ncbi:MAG: glycosyltransferase family 4 protein [Acidimicrobiales bacterium]
MRILVGVTSHPLPPENGMQLHVFHLLKELSKRHEVILVSAPGHQDSASTDALADICSRHISVPEGRHTGRFESELRTVFRGRSKVVDSLARSPLPDAIVDAAAEFRPDVVHVETGALAIVADRVSAPVVVVPLDANDLNAAAARLVAGGPVGRALASREAKRWRRFESTYARCDAVVVVGERDAEMLRVTDPRLRPHVIPNGVDTEWFGPGEDDERTTDIVVHGAMDYPPNIDAAIFAATEILPLVRRHRDVRLVIAGRDPVEAIRALRSESVEVTGTLSDLRPLLRSAGVYLCPMRVGSGIKNKLLEALASGCPIVSTPLGANGVAVTSGLDVCLADDAAGLADEVVALLDHPQRARDMGVAARRVAERMSWAATAHEFERVYRSVLTSEP